MKKITILSSILVLIASSCSNEAILNEDTNANYEKRISVVAEDLTPANGTRTTYTESEGGYHFAWSAGDELGIFPESGHQTDFPISNGYGTNTAVFDGGKWALRPNESYAAYYPLIKEFELNPSAIPVDYTGQVQNGNGSTAHLGMYDFMASTFSEVDAKGNVNFQLQHLGCLVEFQFTMLEADTYSELEVTSEGAGFIASAKYDLADESHTLKDIQRSDIITIGLNNISTTADNKDITITAMFAPVDLTGKTLSLTLKGSDDKIYNFEVDGQDFTKGKAVDNNTAYVNVIPYVTFHADAEQKFSMTREIPTFEYSVNYGEWTTLGATTVTFGGDNGNLRLRGKSSFGTSKDIESSWVSRIQFENNTKVSCSGDIRTLVDYEQYEDADTSNARFMSLFSNNAQLINSPDLPATVLADHCYESMFLNCHNLSEAPMLPAQKLQTGCYNGMFKGCWKINYVKTNAENIHWGYCEEWLEECSSTGIVEKAINWDFEETGYVPFGWSVYFVDSNDNAVNYPDYITFSSFSDQTLQIIEGDIAHNGPLEYSLRNGEWKLLGSEIIEFGGVKGDLRLRKDNNLGTVGTFVFGKETKVQCSGDIRTLIDYKHFSDDICGSFRSLFKDCTQLVQAPQLPSKNLYYEGCYSEMFKGCSSLVQAPALPAERLSRLCYYAMFEDCISLSQPPTLPAMNLADWCYVRMFNGCSSLTQAPALPALKLKDTCYGSMFNGCTSLTSAPELSAEILAEACYGSMFKGCTSLTSAPELSAEILAEACYSNMFNGCTSLNYIKMMATNISATSCLQNWLYNVRSTGTFVKSVDATWEESKAIPSGWEVISASK